MYKLLIGILIAWGTLLPILGQVTLHGTVSDAHTGERLPYARVWIPGYRWEP